MKVTIGVLCINVHMLRSPKLFSDSYNVILWKKIKLRDLLFELKAASC